MKTIDDLNLNQWFMERELPFMPKHFVMTSTVLTKESKFWVLEKLTGRFYINKNKNRVAFEDPAEATFYELKFG